MRRLKIWIAALCEECIGPIYIMRDCVHDYEVDVVYICDQVISMYVEDGVCLGKGCFGR
jgi:hypothetical protein